MRRISCFLLVLFVVAMIVPFSTASAYEGGVLNGKQMYFDTDYNMANGGYTLRSELTDNNNVTHLDATSTRIAYLNLDNIYKITSYTLNYANLNQNAYIWVHFYFKGEVVYQASGLGVTTLTLDVPILTDAVRIDINNLRFNEVDIFGTVADVVPTNLIAQANDAKVDLSWTNAPDISSYVIRRSQTPGGPYTSIGTVTSTTYSANYTDNSVSNGTTYYYIVTGMYSDIETGSTNEAAATPASPTRALLTVHLINGQEREYDLSTTEVNAFLTWYDAKDAGTGPARYAFTKTWNQGPFKSRTEYVIFDKILTFEVNEYDVVTQ